MRQRSRALAHAVAVEDSGPFVFRRRGCGTSWPVRSAARKTVRFAGLVTRLV